MIFSVVQNVNGVPHFSNMYLNKIFSKMWTRIWVYLNVFKDSKQEKSMVRIVANRRDPMLIEIQTNSSCDLSSWFSVINNSDVLTFCILTLFLGNKAPCQISACRSHSAILTTGGQVSSEDMAHSIVPIQLNYLMQTVPNEQLSSDLEIYKLFLLSLDLLQICIL